MNISSYFAQEDLLLIQKDCLSIFSHLTRQKEAIISLLTNKTGMLCLIKGFIGIFPLKEKIFDILTNISLEKHLFSFLTHFGFPFYFFEVILAKELYPMELRVKSFDFLLQSISEKKEIATFFLFNLPESLKAAFYKGNNAFIQALDQEKVLLKEMWTPRMRKELFIKAKIFNETLIQEIMAYKGDYVPLETSLVNDEGYSILKPLFPELKEEIIIDGIFLRSLVKGLGAGFDGVGFLNRVLDEGEAIFNDFTNGFSKEIEGFNRVMNELLLFLSVVILLLEQELYKEEKSFKGKGLNRFIGLLDIKGLNTHVRCSLEQIVLLGLEMGLLEEKPLVEITCRLLKELIAGKEDNNNNLDFSKRLSFVFILFPFIVEEIVLLHILLKSILKERKGLSIVVEIGLECLLWFLEEGENKAYLDDIIMNILGFLVKDLEYGEPTIEILSKVIKTFSLIKYIHIYNRNPILT